jgi:hypothetical protein
MTELTAKPIAWYYELAKSVTTDGIYSGWYHCLTFEKPQVPDQSIRNLTPLYSKDQLNDHPQRPPE